MRGSRSSRVSFPCQMKSRCLCICPYIPMFSTTPIKSIAELLSGLGDLGLIPQLHLNHSSLPDNTTASQVEEGGGSPDPGSPRPGSVPSTSATEASSTTVGSSSSDNVGGVGPSDGDMAAPLTSARVWAGDRLQSLRSSMAPGSGNGVLLGGRKRLLAPSQPDPLGKGSVGHRAETDSSQSQTSAISQQLSSLLSSLLTSAPQILQSGNGQGTAPLTLPPIDVSFSLQTGNGGDNLESSGPEVESADGREGAGIGDPAAATSAATSAFSTGPSGKSQGAAAGNSNRNTIYLGAARSGGGSGDQGERWGLPWVRPLLERLHLGEGGVCCPCS